MITLYAKIMQLHSAFERLCFLLTFSLFRAHWHARDRTLVHQADVSSR